MTVLPPRKATEAAIFHVSRSTSAWDSTVNFQTDYINETNTYNWTNISIWNPKNEDVAEINEWIVNALSTIKVLFIHQLMHQWVVLKNNIKIYIKTYIKQLRHVSVLLLNSTTYSHTITVLTTHRCILMDCFHNCHFSKH